jgi:transcriptional/translational regulatory protein YebC/TACO1
VTTVPVTDLALAKALEKLHDTLDEMDDVQQVFSNEELDDDLSAAAHA